MAKAKRKYKAKKKVAKKKEVAIIPPINLYGEAISFAADAFRAGKSESYIEEVLIEANKKFSAENISFILHQASVSIAASHVRDRGGIVSLHVRRYDQMVEAEMENKFEEIPVPHIRRQLRIQALETVIATLVAKERVLQIHAKETQVKIFNKLNAKIKENKSTFEITQLTFAERVEFLRLIEKAKRTSNELFSVIKRDAVAKAAEIEDIEFEEVNDNAKKIPTTGEVRVIEEIEPQVTLDDLKEKMRATLIRKATEAFKAKGAKEKAPTVIDIRKTYKDRKE